MAFASALSALLPLRWRRRFVRALRRWSGRVAGAVAAVRSRPVRIGGVEGRIWLPPPPSPPGVPAFVLEEIRAAERRLEAGASLASLAEAVRGGATVVALIEDGGEVPRPGVLVLGEEPATPETGSGAASSRGELRLAPGATTHK